MPGYTSIFTMSFSQDILQLMQQRIRNLALELSNGSSSNNSNTTQNNNNNNNAQNNNSTNINNNNNQSTNWQIDFKIWLQRTPEGVTGPMTTNDANNLKELIFVNFEPKEREKTYVLRGTQVLEADHNILSILDSTKVYAQRTTISISGEQWTIGDFVVSVGVMRLPAATVPRSIVVEIEYAPSPDKSCRPLIEEFALDYLKLALKDRLDGRYTDSLASGHYSMSHLTYDYTTYLQKEKIWTAPVRK